MTFRPKVLAAQPGVLLRWIGRLIMPGTFDGPAHRWPDYPGPRLAADWSAPAAIHRVCI